MPTFPTNPLENLALKASDADHTIDLANTPEADALERIMQALQTHASGESLCFRFDGPRGDGQPTLFQPVGRYLLTARREGALTRCLPLAEGNGYVVTLK